MVVSLLAVVIVLVLVGWTAALVDLIHATEMESTGRLILALAVLIAPPLGILLWMGVRGGRAGALVAFGIGLFALLVGITVAAAAMPGRIS